MTCVLPTPPHSLNEPGLYDYLLVNDNLEECMVKLQQIAARAAAGLEAEPNQIPEVHLEEEVGGALARCLGCVGVACLR